MTKSLAAVLRRLYGVNTSCIVPELREAELTTKPEIAAGFELMQEGLVEIREHPRVSAFRVAVPAILAHAEQRAKVNGAPFAVPYSAPEGFRRLAKHEIVNNGDFYCDINTMTYLPCGSGFTGLTAIDYIVIRKINS